jgi:hypothetical protein
VAALQCRKILVTCDTFQPAATLGRVPGELLRCQHHLPRLPAALPTAAIAACNARWTGGGAGNRPG